jgi:hypothetical protein
VSSSDSDSSLSDPWTYSYSSSTISYVLGSALPTFLTGISSSTFMSIQSTSLCSLLF